MPIGIIKFGVIYRLLAKGQEQGHIILFSHPSSSTCTI